MPEETKVDEVKEEKEVKKNQKPKLETDEVAFRKGDLRRFNQTAIGLKKMGYAKFTYGVSGILKLSEDEIDKINDAQQGSEKFNAWARKAGEIRTGFGIEVDAFGFLKWPSNSTPEERGEYREQMAELKEEYSDEIDKIESKNIELRELSLEWHTFKPRKLALACLPPDLSVEEQYFLMDLIEGKPAEIEAHLAELDRKSAEAREKKEKGKKE